MTRSFHVLMIHISTTLILRSIYTPKSIIAYQYHEFCFYLVYYLYALSSDRLVVQCPMHMETSTLTYALTP